MAPYRATLRSQRAENSNQGPLNGGFQTGGVSRSGLVLPFLSFFGLSRFFWDFPDLRGDGSGIFPICPFPLSRPIKSTYEEQSRKGPRHNLDLSRKKWETPRVWKHPGLASLNERSKKFEISSENEIFERATHRGPVLSGEIETSRLKFLSEIKNSIEIENFERD